MWPQHGVTAGSRRRDGSTAETRLVVMSGGRVVGSLLAVTMVLGGGFLALAGMGYIGESADTSAAWAMAGSLMTGLGLALMYTLLRRRR